MYLVKIYIMLISFFSNIINRNNNFNYTMSVYTTVNYGDIVEQFRNIGFTAKLAKVNTDLTSLCDSISNLLMSDECTKAVAKSHVSAVDFLLKNFTFDIQKVSVGEEYTSVYPKATQKACFTLFSVCLCRWSSVWEPAKFLPQDWSLQYIISVYGTLPPRNNIVLHKHFKTVTTCLINNVSSLTVLLSSNSTVSTNDLNIQTLNITQHYGIIAFKILAMICSLKSKYGFSVECSARQLTCLLYHIIPYEDLRNLDIHYMTEPVEVLSNTVENVPKTPLCIVNNEMLCQSPKKRDSLEIFPFL